MREISLTQGKVTLVDDEDHQWLNRWKWYAHNSHGHWYAESRVNFTRQILLMHRLILGAKHGEDCDHINGDGLDNRRANLRICTPSQNAANNCVRCTPKTSKFKGVSWETRKRRWRACIQADDKQVHLGYFSDELRAAEAYDCAARKSFGIYAQLNLPNSWGPHR